MSERGGIEAVATRVPNGDRDVLACDTEQLLPPSIVIEITLATLVHALGTVPRLTSITVLSVGLSDGTSELELRSDVGTGLVEVTRVRPDGFPRRVPVMLAEFE